MATTFLAPTPKLQFFDANGAPLAGGKLYTYEAGSTTPQVTYTDYVGGTANTNPVILDSRGEASVWLNTPLYKMALYDSTNVLIWTVDNIGGFVTLAQLAESGGSNLIGYLPAGAGAVATTVQTKLREVVSVLDFGADPTGVADSGEAIRTAITSLPANGGGVYFPNGTYKVTAAVGDPSNTAIYVPTGVRIYGASEIGTKIIPGSNNTVIFRMIGLNGGIDNIQIDNPSSTYTNVSGIRLAPTDETQTTTRSDVEFNNITNVSIRRVREAIVLKCGPRVGGADSYCYYNNFTNIDIRNCLIGVWLKIPNGGSPGSGVNRNRFINLRAGETGTNTGLQIDAGDTNTFVGCSFEGITSGTSPSSTPTAIVVDYNSATYSCTDNKFYGLTIEACTRSVSNKNDFLEFYGYYDATNTFNVPPPVGALPLAVNMSRGKVAGTQVGTNRTPTATGDFYTYNNPSIVQVVTGIGGKAEFRVDTATAYGLFSYYNAGVKQWSMGSLATGSGNLTIFNASDSIIGQFVATSGGAFKPLQSASAPTYIKGAIYFDTTLDKLRVGGATGWETITSV